MKLKTLLVLSIAAAPVATPAVYAANADGLYLGIGGGHGNVKNGASDMSNFVDADGEDYRVDDDDNVYKAFVGYEYSRYFATEAFYTDLGEASLTNGDNVVDLRSKAYGLSLVGKLPVTDGFELFAKAGMARWDTEARGDLGGGSNDLDDNDGIDPVYGAGAQLHLRNWLLRAEYERYHFDSDYQVDTYTASVGWQF